MFVPEEDFMPAARSTSTHLFPCNGPLPLLGINGLDNKTPCYLSLRLTFISTREKNPEKAD